MSGYGQFCPVAKAMELLDERWTLLVVRELLLGSRHFNDLRRGVPKMSPALLSKRLKSLTRAGVIERHDTDGRTSYTLTQCGQELAGVARVLMNGAPAGVGELGEEDLDPHLLMWDIRRSVPVDAWPRARTVTLAFQLRGGGSRGVAVVVGGGRRPGRHARDFDPGYEPSPRPWTPACAPSPRSGGATWICVHYLMDGTVTVSGAADARRAVPTWIGQGSLAAVPRPA